MNTAAAKPNPLLEVAIAIVVPAVILMKFSGEADLGPVRALLVALAFPLAWALWEAWQRRKLSWIAALGVVSTLLTGGIGLLKLDAQWLAVKEAAVPGLIGLAVLISTRTRYPLVRALIYNPTVMDIERVNKALDAHQAHPAFEARLLTATRMLAGTFFFSAAMNYVLARWIVTSPSGSEAFNAELGRLTLLSYPMIALPSMLMMVGVMVYLARALRGLTGLKLGEILHGGQEASGSSS